MTGFVYQNKRMAGALRPLLSSPVTLIAAPPGYGKTEAVRGYLGKRKSVETLWLWGGGPPELPGPSSTRASLYAAVLDGADLAGAEALRRLLEWAGSEATRRLVLLCRTVTPQLSPLLYSGSCAFLGKEDLAFTRDEAADYYRRRGLLLSEAVWETAVGWPVMLHTCADYGGVLSERCREKLVGFVRTEVLPALPEAVREALLHPPRAGHRDGKRKTERLLAEYARDGLLSYDGSGYRAHPLLLAALEEEEALLFGPRESPGPARAARSPKGRRAALETKPV